ncbi:MOSC domain-containing protein [Mycolicibacterium sp. D5.8-2]|uniref:MOSC domain-containing protein n=1 Tax=Mycolicibacterium sp. D5.8-2 TaxID=3085903 RepID=UPI0009F6475C|nr:MOSC domain-containing protein [Mycolicibacterium sp. D5.8-2]MDW5615141.1 MOSC domain-containing protein [Mycolicibacterium sp. D5.8-2]
MTTGTVVGRVAHLDVTAVKGFAVVDAERITVTDTGILGNREFFFVEPDGRIYSVDVDSALLPYWSRFEPATNRLAIGDGQNTILDETVPVGGEVVEFDFTSSPRAGRFVEGPWDAWASSVAGRQLALVRSVSPGEAYDAYPLTFQSEASLAALGREVDGTPIDRRRFRMQITLSGVDTAFSEDEWAGRSATIGTCGVRVGGPVPRCVGVEHNPTDQARTVKVLHMINQIRGVGHGEFGKGLMFGVYASVVKPGDINVGDDLTLDASID